MTKAEAIKYLKTWNPIHPFKQEARAKAIRALMEQPKKGHWVMKHRHRKAVKVEKGFDKYGEEHEIEFVEESEGDEPYCSECGAAAAESFQNFCPKCGADMRKNGEQE